jgi:hypothetical protein
LDEDKPIPDTARDFELAQCLFGELNRDLLGPPDDGKVIILSDSDEEEEEHTRRSLPASKTRLLLLQSTRAQPPPPTTSALQLRSLQLQLPPLSMLITTSGQSQMIVVMV